MILNQPILFLSSFNKLQFQVRLTLSLVKTQTGDSGTIKFEGLYADCVTA